MDEEETATNFDACHEDLRYLTVYPASIRAARQQYSFLSDKLDDYESLPIDEYVVIER